MHDLTTGVETPITTDPSIQESPAVYGDRIVWHDNRSGNWDIYLYTPANVSAGKAGSMLPA